MASSLVTMSAPSAARASSLLTVGPSGACSDAATSAVSSARSTLIMTGGSSLVTGTVGTDWVSCVNATVKSGKVAEPVGDTDIPSSDKIGITIYGDC